MTANPWLNLDASPRRWRAVRFGAGYLASISGARRLCWTSGLTKPTLAKGLPMISIEFLITSLVVVLIPGTGVIFTVSTGIVQGRKASIYAAMGCTARILPHLLATVLGLAVIMHTSALAFQALKYAGVAYLLYIAYATWRDKSAFVVDSST